MQVIPYLYQFIKTNNFTVWFIVVLLGISLVRYTPLFLSIKELLSNKKKMLLLVVFLALGLRLVWCFTSGYVPRWEWGGYNNLSEFDLNNIHAVDITKGKWFVSKDGAPMVRRPIGYPIFLGGLYTLFGTNLWVVKISSLFLFFISLFFIFKIAQILFSDRVAWISALLFSIYPISILSVTLVTGEQLFLPLLFGGIYLLLLDLKGRPIRFSWILYGIIFGYATMTRTHTIFMPVAISLTYLLAKRPLKQVVGVALVVFTFMQVVNSPWVIRNYSLWKKPLLYTANFSYVYSNYNSNAIPEGQGRIPEKGEIGYSAEFWRAMESENPARISSASVKEVLRWVYTDPLTTIPLSISRLLVFVGWNKRGIWPIWLQFEEGQFDPERPLPQWLRDGLEEVSYIFYYIIFYACLLAFWLYVSRKRKIPLSSRLGVLFIAIIFGGWFVEHMFIYPARKYRYPLEPLMLIFAATFFEYLLFQFQWKPIWSKVTRWRHSQR